MNVQVKLNDVDISSYTISYERSKQICSGAGTASIQLASDFPTEIVTYDEIKIYEESIHKGTYFVSSITVDYPSGTKTLDCQDGSILIADYFVYELYDIGLVPVLCSAIIKKYLDEVGISYDFTTYDGDSLIAEGATFGTEFVKDIVVGLCQQCGWFFKFDENNTCVFGSFDLGTGAATVTDADIKTITRSEDDAMARNEVKIWGGYDEEGNLITYNVDDSGDWQRDSNDDRAIILSNAWIDNQPLAETLAAQLLDEYNTTTTVYDIELVGEYDLDIGDTLTVSSSFYSGDEIITTLGTTMEADGFITKITLGQRCPRQFIYYGSYYYDTDETVNLVRSYFKSGSMVIPVVLGDFERDISGTIVANWTSFHEVNESYPQGVVRNEDYIYYRDSSQTYPTIVEYQLSTKTKTSVEVLADTKDIYYGVIGNRQIGVFVNDETSYTHTVYTLNFNLETSTKVHTFNNTWTDALYPDFEYWCYNDFHTLFLEYNDNIYIVAVYDAYLYDSGSSPYEDDGGIIWFVYNVTTNTGYEEIWQPHNDSRLTGYSGTLLYAPLAYYEGKVMCVPSAVDFNDGNDGTVFHIIDLDSMSTDATFLASGSGWNTYTYRLAIDYTQGVAYSVTDYASATLETNICKYIFSSDTPSIWKTNTAGYILCPGQTEIYFYDKDVDTWYNRYWTSPLSVTEPANGYDVRDNVSYAFSDAKRYIWWFDSINERMHGLRHDGAKRYITSLNIPYPVNSPERMYVYNLGDIFVMISMDNASGNVEYFTVE